MKKKLKSVRACKGLPRGPYIGKANKHLTEVLKRLEGDTNHPFRRRFRSPSAPILDDENEVY